MSRFELNILGCGSATPSTRHMPSCQIVNFRDKLMMVDCGEGAQLTMRRMGLKFSRLGHIFLSHLHGDHVFGLPGLLSTLALHEKGGEMVVHTFAEGKEILAPFIDYFSRDMPYRIVWDVITPQSGIIFEDSGLTVETFPLYHRIPATGFIFREKPGLRSFRPEMRDFYKIPVKDIAGIKAGADFVTADGRVIPNEHITLPPPPTVSYAYCSDTMADPRVVKAIEGVDIVYHEATYLHEYAVKARQRGHSTAREAAEVARDAGARCLIIGHYSKRYPDVAPLLEEARSVFPATIAAEELMTLNLKKITEENSPI